jgi:GT2 family glycosyltransferase
VNYASPERTCDFVKELSLQDGVDRWSVLVVDNTETGCDARLHDLEAKYAFVTVLWPGANLGYFGGARYGMDWYLRRARLPKWTVVSNVDLMFPHGDFLKQLMDRPPDQPGDVIAPDIILERTGRPMNPFMRYRPSALHIHAKKWTVRYRVTRRCLVLLSNLKSVVVGRIHVRQRPAVQYGSIRIYAPHGSCIAFRDSYFRAGASLVHGTFLYGEEMTVAENAARLSLEVRFVPQLRLLHAGGVSTKVSPEAARFQSEASAYVADTYFPLSVAPLSRWR